MGKRSRDKGQRFERLIAHAFATIWPDACRGIGQTRRGSDHADVEGTPWWVETKVGQRPNIYAAMRQAEEARDDRPPIVISRKNSTGGGKPSVDLVSMKLADWMGLVDRAAKAEALGRHPRRGLVTFLSYAAGFDSPGNAELEYRAVMDAEGE